MNTGASKFIIKLKSELIKYDLPKYNIVTSKKDIHLLSENSQIIGRLDGVAYYKMTIENFLNLLFLWKGIRVKSPKVLNNVNFFYSNKVINKYLNRYNKLILKKSNKIIFQSFKGQLPNGALEDNIVSIDLSTSIVTHLRIYTDEYIATQKEIIRIANEKAKTKFGSAAILDKKIPQKYKSLRYGIIGIAGNVIEVQYFIDNSLSGYSEFIDLTKNEFTRSKMKQVLKCSSNYGSYDTNANEESIIKNLLKKLY